MITRKVGSLIRGKATPFQITLACILGGLLGAVPGFSQGPGLILFYLSLLLVLNANLFVAAVTLSLSKLISLLAMPVQFEIGRVLLDGPTDSLFSTLVNTPVLAWFGFEYYAVTGGVVIGGAFGLILALVMVRILNSTRRRLAALESKDPEERGRMQKTLENNKLAKFFVWVFIGKRGKKSYKDLASTKIGNPIRIMGVVVVVLFAGLLAIGLLFLQEPLVTAGLKKGLEQANGATVDLDSAEVDLQAGVVTATGLAMADPENLGTDILRAQTLTADLGTRDLLTRRYAFDLIEVNEASSGEERRIPGVLTRPRPEPAETPEGEGKTIDDYLQQAEQWKERLRQAREWLEKAQSDDPDATDPSNPDQTEEEREKSYRDRLRERVAALGYANVRAEHLIEGAPTLLIREVRVNGLRVAQLEGEVLDLNGTNLATQPRLLESGRPRLDLTSRSGNLSGALLIAAQPGETTTMNLLRKGLSGDAIGQMLAAIAGQPPVVGGEVDLDLTASLLGPMLNGSLGTTFRNSTLQIAGNATQVENLTVPIGLSGPIDAPRIALTDEALKQALLDAGKAELANRVGGEVGKVLDEAIGDNEELKEVTDQVKDRLGGLGGLLGGDDDDDDGDGGGE